MRRQLIAVGLAVATLLLFALITATLAAPDAIWLLQVGENEPNNSFDEAATVPVPGYVTGEVTRSLAYADSDYFLINTEIGREYRIRLNIWTTGTLKLQASTFNSSREYIDTSSSSSSYTSLSWTANYTSHYILLESLDPNTTTFQIANYQMNIDEFAATPTPTNTPMPGYDDYEPNNDKDHAYVLPIATAASATDCNFYPAPDEDWFAFYVKSGRHYRASTGNLIGVDTYLEVYEEDGDKIGSDNDGGGGFASKFEWKASYNGYYYIKVTNLVTSDSDDTYDLTISEIGEPATSTPTPVPGPVSGLDDCEDNTTFDRACVIAANQSRTFNFVSPHSGPDNDYFKIWVKPGLIFDCRTSDLSPGVDPNMILYDHNRNPIGGNDDVTPGDYNCAFSYYATYEGWLYLLVGTGDRTPSDLSNSNYTLVCNTRLPGEATPTPGPGETSTPRPTDTPQPGATPTASPTATPLPGLTVRALTTPTPVPVETPVPRFIPVRLLVYYDSNDDRQPGAGEGVSGISAQAYEAVTNQLLAQGFTDAQGYLEFTVAAQGPVRVSVPFFGFSQLIAGEGASVYLRIPPQTSLGGTP